MQSCPDCRTGPFAATQAAARLGARVPELAPAPHVVADPGDLASGGGDRGHQDVRVLKGQGGCDLVLILQEELVLLALGDPVQLHPDAGEDGGGVFEGTRSA